MAGSIRQDRSHDRILQCFFGDISQAKELMKRHLSFISVEPIFRKRLSIYTTMPVFVLPWEIFLLDSGFEKEEVRKF